MLDDVLLGELAVVVGRDVLLELLERLVAEVAAVDQEQHAPRAGELDEAVDEVDGGEGLAAAGGHLDEGARRSWASDFSRFLMAVTCAGQRPVVLSGGSVFKRARRVVTASAARDAPLRSLGASLRCGIKAASVSGR